MADANIAASRAEAALDVSGSGEAELSRRSAAATEPGRRGLSGLSAPTTPPRVMTGDEILRDRVQLALSSPTPGTDVLAQPLSIAHLSNLRMSARDGVVTLRGTVPSMEEKSQIESIVCGVEGVRSVVNELTVAPAPGLPSTE
jgi:hypothetical protein